MSHGVDRLVLGGRRALSKIHSPSPASRCIRGCHQAQCALPLLFAVNPSTTRTPQQGLSFELPGSTAAGSATGAKAFQSGHTETDGLRMETSSWLGLSWGALGLLNGRGEAKKQMKWRLHLSKPLTLRRNSLPGRLVLPGRFQSRQQFAIRREAFPLLDLARPWTTDE
jgi:hypothetical protein